MMAGSQNGIGGGSCASYLVITQTKNEPYRFKGKLAGGKTVVSINKVILRGSFIVR